MKSQRQNIRIVSCQWCGKNTPRRTGPKKTICTDCLLHMVSGKVPTEETIKIMSEQLNVR